MGNSKLVYSLDAGTPAFGAIVASNTGGFFWKATGAARLALGNHSYKCDIIIIPLYIYILHLYRQSPQGIFRYFFIPTLYFIFVSSPCLPFFLYLSHSNKVGSSSGTTFFFSTTAHCLFLYIYIESNCYYFSKVCKYLLIRFVFVSKLLYTTICIGYIL